MSLIRNLSKSFLAGRRFSLLWVRNRSSLAEEEDLSSPFWRDASSLIVTARDKGSDFEQGEGSDSNGDNNYFDYKVLLLEKSKKSKLMGGSNAFPGGLTCEADFSIDWANIYTHVQKRDLGDIIGELNLGRKRPPILTNVKHAGIPPELGFRIAAIRKTFEETGVLLVKGARMPSIEDKVIDEFKDKVKRDPRKFALYCKELSVVPDVWALKEWGNWLTPVQPGEEVKEAPAVPKRFDTLFYLCCLDWIPLVQCDEKDISDAQWITPGNASSERKITGPQAFELSRIYNFKKLSTLHTFSSQRSTLGLERYMPVYFKCQDGLLAALPGDDLYPDKPDLEGLKPAKTLPHTLADLRDVSKRHHRQELPDDGKGDPSYVCSVNLRYGQPLPPKQFYNGECLI